MRHDERVVNAQSRGPESALLIRQYFADGLDPIQTRAFKRRLETDPAFAEQVDAAWDAAVQRQGLRALAPQQGVWTGCFAEDTLARYASGALDDIEMRLVQGHLACARCEGRIAALREQNTEGAAVQGGPPGEAPRLSPVADGGGGASGEAPRLSPVADGEADVRYDVMQNEARPEVTVPADEPVRYSSARALSVAMAIAASLAVATLVPQVIDQASRRTARGDAVWTDAVRIEPFVEVGDRRQPILANTTHETPMVLGIDYVNWHSGPVYFAAVFIDAAGRAHWLVPDDGGRAAPTLARNSAADGRFRELWSVEAVAGPAQLRWRLAQEPFPLESMTAEGFEADADRGGVRLMLRRDVKP